MKKLHFTENGFRPAQKKWVPSLQTIQLSDNFLCFFDGRGKAGEPVFGATDENWPQVDMDLGIACYTLFQGSEAVVFDTMILPEQAAYVRSRLKSLGVKKFTVINTHMDLDHVGGNSAFADCEIIALQGTFDALSKYKTQIEKGEFWGPPAVKPLTLPNTLINKDTARELAGFELHLLRVDAHQEGGSLCIHIPEYRALIVGDVVEDAAVYVNQPQDLLTNIAETKHLLELDIDYVFPMHGNPAMIARGAYGKRFIESAIVYQQRLFDQLESSDYLNSNFNDFMGDFLAEGVITPYEAYIDIHKMNTANIYKHWHKKNE